MSQIFSKDGANLNLSKPIFDGVFHIYKYIYIYSVRITSTGCWYIYIYIWRALFQNAICAIPKKKGLAIAMLISKIVLWKSAFYIGIYAYICTYLWRTLLQNLISELDIGIANSIFGSELIAFRKRTIYRAIYDANWRWRHWNKAI